MGSDWLTTNMSGWQLPSDGCGLPVRSTHTLLTHDEADLWVPSSPDGKQRLHLGHMYSRKL
jgi:hypothetical protein